MWHVGCRAAQGHWNKKKWRAQTHRHKKIHKHNHTQSRMSAPSMHTRCSGTTAHDGDGDGGNSAQAGLAGSGASGGHGGAVPFEESRQA